MRQIGHFISGKERAGNSGRSGDIFNPNTGEVQAKIAFASKAEVGQAVANAEAAQVAWAATNAQRRARVLFKFLELAQKEFDSLAALLSSEHGKTIADSRGDIQRGLEVVEFACGIPHLLKGEFSDSAGPGIDLFSLRQPLGVVAGITPFNFPAMIPMWKFAPALACGNAFILKPSERDPSVPMRLAELLIEAGLPAGVLNVVNGDKEAVDALLTDPRVKAIGFVGSSADRGIHLRDRMRPRKARAMLRRRQKPHGCDAGCRHGPGGGCAHWRRLWLGGRALHGGFGRRAGRQEDGRYPGRETHPARREPEGRTFERSQADYGPMVTKAHLEKVKQYVELGIRKAPSSRWMAGISRCRATRTAFSWGLPVRRCAARYADLQRGNFWAGALGGARQGL